MKLLLLAMLLLVPTPEKEKEEIQIPDCYLQWHREGRGPIYMLEYSECDADRDTVTLAVVR